MRTIFAAILAAGCLLGAAASAQEQKSFRDWWVVCDNSLECAAFGFSAEEGEGYLKIERRAGPGGRLEAGLVVLAGEGRPVPHSWSVRADGKVLFDRLTFEDAGSGAAWSVQGDAARRLVNAARDASSLTVEGPGGVKVAIVLSGASASLRYIDERQGRAGQADALAAIGKVSPAAARAAPARPVIDVPASPAQTAIPVTPPTFLAALRKTGEGCDVPMEGEEDPVIKARLGPNLMLWGLRCSSGAYNVDYRFFTTDDRGKNPRAQTFAYASGTEQKDTLYVTNPEFDSGSLILSSFERARGIGDCGAILSWAWTGKAFALVSQDIMSDCHGVGSEHWPSLYRATVNQAVK